MSELTRTQATKLLLELWQHVEHGSSYPEPVVNKWVDTCLPILAAYYTKGGGQAMSGLTKYTPCLNGSAFAGMFCKDGLYPGTDHAFYLAADVDAVLRSQWTCGCGWVNGINLNLCARCTRTPNDGNATQP